MGIALYDASRVASQFSRNGAQNSQAKYLENAYFDSRGIDSVSICSLHPVGKAAGSLIKVFFP